MSRINLTIDRIVLRGVRPGDRTPLVEGLRAELTRVLADPASRAEWASRRAPVVKLGRVPVAPGPSSGRGLGGRIGGAIAKGLKT